MKKKLCAILMTMVMCISLVACGGVDKQPAIDAFNSASDVYDTLANKLNADSTSYPQELFDVMNEMADYMLEYKTVLESDEELTEEMVAEMIQAFGEVEQWAIDTDSQLADLVIVTVDEQPVIDAFNSASTAFDAVAAQINANIEAYPQDVIDVFTQAADVLNQCKEMLESDVELTEEDVTNLVTELNNIETWVASAEAELLVALGTEEMQAAIDYFNAVSTMYDAAATVVNDNASAFDAEFINTLSGIAETLTQYKELLDNGYQFNQEEYDTMMGDLEEIGNWIIEQESKLFG